MKEVVIKIMAPSEIRILGDIALVDQIADDTPTAENQWTATGLLSGISRMRPAVTVLNDGEILIAGGARYDGDIYTSTVQSYTETTGEDAKSNLPNGIYNAQMQALENGDAYLFGGYSSSFGYTDEGLVYNLASNSWSKHAPYPIKNQSHISVSVKGNIYSFGGHNGAFISSSYKFESGSWAPIKKLPVPTAYMAASALNDGRILLVGGRTLSGWTNECYIYDPSSDSYSSASPIPVEQRGLFSETLLDGRVVVGSGEDKNGSYSNKTYIYDPVGDAWSDGKLLPFHIGFCSSAKLANGTIYLFGGNLSDNSQSSHIIRLNNDNLS